MIFGGAIGNLYDRIFFKAVPDFIDFHIGTFHWFVFNIADIFISLGIICLMISELFLFKNTVAKQNTIQSSLTRALDTTLPLENIRAAEYIPFLSVSVGRI